MSRNQPKPPTVRCAIYTRKSTEEGLQQDFNTLDAQRDAGEKYVASQSGEGWICLPDRYDDGGFTGGNMERPALKRLMADIDAGKIDCVVVYKVDRLSRSLTDFARLLEAFDKRHVGFTAVTQQFSTTTSVGRLTMNMLLSFAQFERELVSERTRDKIAASRRRGQWSGGHSVLGYDVERAPGGCRLVINEEEAGRVRAIYDLYLQHQGLVPVVTELARRGWVNKRWATKDGRERGGRPFDKCTLHALLTSVIYIGKVQYKSEVHQGEHEGLIEHLKWQRVQQVLSRNGRSGGAEVRNRYGALLKGILHCSPCGCSMGHTYSSKGNRRYRYYRCASVEKRGRASCATPSVPAAEIERVVIEQIRVLLRDPQVVTATLREARKQATDAMAVLKAEDAALGRQLRQSHADVRRLAGAPGEGISHRLADLNEHIRIAEQRLGQIRDESRSLADGLVDERQVVAALNAFEPLWDQLSPKEQARVVRLLVQRVDFDGSQIQMTFHPGGFAELANEPGDRKEAAA